MMTVTRAAHFRQMEMGRECLVFYRWRISRRSLEKNSEIAGEYLKRIFGNHQEISLQDGRRETGDAQRNHHSGENHR